MSGRSKKVFADVILPLALGKPFTYHVPFHFDELKKGCRVVVQFGKARMYTAIVYEVHNREPEAYQAKDIIEVLDNNPVITETQFRLWEWIAEYYLCSLGEIMIAALPAIMKLQSESMVVLSPSYADNELVVTPEEQLVIDHLVSEKSITIGEASRLTGIKNGVLLIRNMIDRGILIHHEEMQEPFRPRQVSCVRLTERASDETFMKEMFEKLEKKAPRQLEMLMTFLRLKMDKGKDAISKSLLVKSAGGGISALNQLVAKGVLEIFNEENYTDNLREPGRQVAFNEMQQQAYEEITSNFNNNKVTLLHGVTSSGKTEVYIRLINDVIGSNKQVLYLLPEIALTTQIITRLKNHFGDRVLVYHSRFSSRDRAGVYMKMLGDGKEGHFKYPIIIGARSAIFLPLVNPGLIIVDEEHDSSFKQHDPAPRYNARDNAIVCGQLYGCSVLLGSATPSLESYHNAETGKYELVRMSERYGGLKLPSIHILDLKEAYKKKQVKSNFSQLLLDTIKSSLESNEQVILFQNRRGFAPVLECRNCGWIPHCINCDVTLTYHKKSNQLRCHYCGYHTLPPVKCAACGDADVRMKGMGTERIEDEISLFFPDYRVERLDLDTTSSKTAFLRILSGFENGEIDILVGTQMVTKGLDFDNVSLVGVLNADHLINFPDFRSVERSYQLLAQVAGRAGRKFKQGKVIVQTFQPQHPLLHFLVNNDYNGFYRYELAEREKFAYPPFYRLISLRLKHRDEQVINELSSDFCRELRLVFGKRVLGPVTPDISRVRNFYLRNILIKLEKNLSNKKVKEMITRVADRFLSHPGNRSLVIQVDVDPM